MFYEGVPPGPRLPHVRLCDRLLVAD